MALARIMQTHRDETTRRKPTNRSFVWPAEKSEADILVNSFLLTSHKQNYFCHPCLLNLGLYNAG